MNQQTISNFQQLYLHLNRDTVSCELLAEVYADNIQFQDPFHHIQGLQALSGYFVGLYQNVEHIEFDFGHYWQQDNHTFIRWQMHYRHPRIHRGKTVTVDGGSELIWQNDRIIQQRDFFDAGQMLYEKLPFIGWLIRKLKERMS